MRTIIDLSPSEFLKQCYLIADHVQHFLETTKIAEVQQNVKKPEFEENESDESRLAKTRKYGAAIINAVFRRLMNDYPEETEKIARLLIVDDTSGLTGVKLFGIALNVLKDESVIDFFSSCIQLMPMLTGG